ncbi:MAG: hypothetical protein OFPII_41790 [Osedax symbiont Rs1]|nr:MAG: hypothetical protein OFPII_41790 [Osedax symbiont Rs1]
MITLHQIKVFIAVTECGGTSAAARALHLSQPTISLTVRNLEEQLGGELFIRNPPKGLAITPFGRSKLEEARTLLSQAEMFSEQQNAAPQLRGPITIGYFATLGPLYIPRLIRRLKDKLPKVEVQLQEGVDLTSMNRMLNSGQVELALTYDLSLGDRPKVHQLKECEFYAVLPQDHPLAQKTTVSIKELAEEDFIQIDLPSSSEFLMSPFWHYKLEPKIEYKTNSLEMLRGMVANNLGVSLLITRPDSDISYDGSGLVCRPISEALPKQKLVLAQSHQLSPTPVAIAVIAEIKAMFKEE